MYGTKKIKDVKNRKKWAVCMLVLLLMLLLAACGPGRGNVPLQDGSIEGVNIEGGSAESGNTAGGSSMDGSAASGSSTGGSSTDGTAAGMAENTNNGNQPKQDSTENKYKAILLGNADFICRDLGNQSLNIKNIGQVVTDDTNVTINVTQFAVADLDGDGENEVILWMKAGSTDMGFEVLYNQNETVYGIMQYYRELMDLKTDGTFSFSGGAADNGAGRMVFSDTGYSVEEQVYCQSKYDTNNTLIIQYFLQGAPCSAEEFQSAMEEQSQKENVKWYALSAENLDAVFENLP